MLSDILDFFSNPVFSAMDFISEMKFYILGFFAVIGFLCWLLMKKVNIAVYILLLIICVSPFLIDNSKNIENNIESHFNNSPEKIR